MKSSVNNISKFVNLIFLYDKKFIFLFTIDIIITAIAPFPTIILSKKVFDIIDISNTFGEYIFTVLIWIFGAIFLNLISTYINSLVEIFGQQLMNTLNIKYNFKSLRISYELLTHPHTLELRELAAKAIDGSNFIDMIRNFKNIISNVLTLMGIFALFTQIDLYVILVVIIVIIINALANNIIKKAQYKWSVQVIPYSRKLSYLNSTLSGLETGKEIRINALKSFMLSNSSKLNKDCFKFIKKTITAQTRGFQISNITNGIQDCIVYLILGYKILIEQKMSIGDFSMYFNAIQTFKTSLITIINSFANLKIMGFHIGHFIKYMDLPEEQITSENVSNFKELKFESIKFENVSFKYPGQEAYVLKNVSFKIKKDEKLSIVGLNGAGKTSLIKLMLKLYEPTKGNIYINDINIKDIDHEKYYKFFSVVFQDYKLLAFSIKDNICCGNYNSKKLMNILRKVGLDDKINRLEFGYNTSYSRLFDENGVEFSGGESQKLVIARALYRNTPIIIMDEPTSALDPLAEHEIFNKLNELSNGKTTVFVSHRLSSCRFCDKILVLDNGYVKEYGSHDTLLKQKGLYYKMYSKQASYYLGKKREKENE